MKDRMFFYTVFIGLLVVGLIAVQACQPAEDSLTDTEWHLLTIGKTSVMDNTDITLKFSKDEVSGNASCNSYFASYETQGSNLTMDAIGMTEMWCMDPDGIMDQETRYLQSLSKIDTFSIANGKLTLLLNDGDQLIFEAQ
jgi:heat shock protein HslJ